MVIDKVMLGILKVEEACMVGMVDWEVEGEMGTGDSKAWEVEGEEGVSQ